MSTCTKILAALVSGPCKHSDLAACATDSGDLAWTLATLRSEGRVAKVGSVYSLAQVQS
jgi:hypothetical protein